jgi:hypothetical protein
MTNTTRSKLNLINSGQEGSVEDSFITEWLLKHGKNILYALAILVFIFIALFRFGTNHTMKQEQDYIQAMRDFTVFAKGVGDEGQAETSKQALKQLDTIMSSHQELHAAYDGEIAQLLLNQGKIKEALPYATATLERVASDQLPLYADYANTSLLISEGKTQEALKRSLALQEKMSSVLNQQETSKKNFGDELFALNLFRIGMLRQELGDKAGELATWKEWKKYAALTTDANKQNVKVETQAFYNVIQQLAIGTFSLPDYINYREKQLNKQDSLN